MKHLVLGVLACGAFLATTEAKALTITFDGLAKPEAYGLGSAVQVDGFHLQENTFNWPGLVVWGTQDVGLNADPDGATITLMQPHAVLTLGPAQGASGPFTFNSIDLAHYANNVIAANPFNVEFGFLRGAAWSYRTVTVDAAPGLQTFDFYESDVDFVLINPLSNRLQLDNLVVNELAAVPEPATWALLILGFGSAGLALRARRTSHSASQSWVCGTEVFVRT